MTDLLSGSTDTSTDTPDDSMAVLDEGTAYGMGPGTSNLDLVQVGAGTPGGEAMRRFWHPVALSTDVTDLPVPIRLLGEDLILFRTTRGRAGLVHPRCAHRGTTLLYGKVEDEGIRCCYHGWLFDPEGRTLEQPCEPDGGLKKHKFRQPWYPVQERYGIVFAYLGPPEHKPLLPRYAPIENVPEGMVAVASNNTRILGGPPVIGCNWMQSYENVMDAWHVFVLHSTLSDAQFNTLFAVAPEITWEASPYGMRTLSTRRLSDGQVLRRVSEVMLPTVWTVPPPTQTSYGPGREIYWHQPIDDTHTRVFAVVVVPDAEAAAWHDRTRSPMYEGGTKSWYDLTDEEHRRYPGDYEAQAGQGAITLHSEEHLAGSDRGVSMYRRLWRAMIDDVRAGRELANVARVPGTETVTPKAGTYLGLASEATI